MSPGRLFRVSNYDIPVIDSVCHYTCVLTHTKIPYWLSHYDIYYHLNQKYYAML